MIHNDHFPHFTMMKNKFCLAKFMIFSFNSTVYMPLFNDVSYWMSLYIYIINSNTMSINTSTISTHEIQQYIFLFRNKNVYKKKTTKNTLK